MQEERAPPTLAVDYLEIASAQRAFSQVLRIFVAQKERAILERAQPNVGTHGDATARSAFWSALTTEQQRRMFMQLIQDRRFWPRIRTTIGAPPFSFLLQQDEYVLNAAGISKSRSRMAPPKSNSIFSSVEIGKGHLFDENGVVYRLQSTDMFEHNKDSFFLKTLAQCNKAVLDFRCKKRDRDEKPRLPKPGQTISLKFHSEFKIDAVVALRVRMIALRGDSLTVGRVFVQRI